MEEKCNHDWQEDINRVTCSLCGKSKLKRVKVTDEIYTATKVNGMKYTIRRDRTKYFYPNEWNKFHANLNNDFNKLLFSFLIGTGARIEEALHFKKTDLIDDQRHVIRLMVTKRKAKKLEEKEQGKVRSFEIGEQLYKELKKQPNLYIFLRINKELSLVESKKIARGRSCGARSIMKSRLALSGMDSSLYSLHNIRKTHGMWLKSLGVPMEEICLRLGHDVDTYLAHYGSPSIFDGRDNAGMIKIIGRIYNL